MKKSNKCLIATLLILLALTGYLIFYPAEQKQESVRIGYLPILASLPLYVAQENGYFADANIQIETIQLQSSNLLVDALIRGDIDFVVESSAVPAIIAETIDPGKIKVFSISDITPEAPFDALIIKKDSELITLEDIKDKKIGVFPGSTATKLLKKFLDDKNIDTSGIEFVQLIPPNQLPALTSGSIDVLHSYEPITAIALENGDAKKLYGSVYAEQLNHNPQGVALVSASFLKDSPETAKEVIGAFDRTSDFIRENDSETRRIVSKYVKVDKKVASKVVFLYMSKSNKIDHQVLQDYADMLHELGELEGKLDVSNIVYNE